MYQCDKRRRRRRKKCDNRIEWWHGVLVKFDPIYHYEMTFYVVAFLNLITHEQQIKVTNKMDRIIYYLWSFNSILVLFSVSIYEINVKIFMCMFFVRSGSLAHIFRLFSFLFVDFVAVCSLDCGPNGICESGKCRCNPGYVGNLCDQLPCDARCAEHGQCKNGTCVCSQGWNGRHCTLRKYFFLIFFFHSFLKWQQEVKTKQQNEKKLLR